MIRKVSHMLVLMQAVLMGLTTLLPGGAVPPARAQDQPQPVRVICGDSAGPR
jgi:hypothetical protein